jgi:hypothetical protein
MRERRPLLMLPVGHAVFEASPDAEAFVRFCYQRRRVGWPELYDEMWAVASRGLFRGMGATDLEGVGIGFSLFQTPRLAALVTRIVGEEQALRRRLAAAPQGVAPAPTLMPALAPTLVPVTPVPAEAADSEIVGGGTPRPIDRASAAGHDGDRNADTAVLHEQPTANPGPAEPLRVVMGGGGTEPQEDVETRPALRLVAALAMA